MTIVSTSQTVNIIANALGVRVDSSDQLASAKSVNGSVENLTTVRAAEQAQLSVSNISHTLIFKDIAFAFRMSFLNKCDELERSTVSEFFQRCFDIELPESILLKAASE